MTKKIQIGNLYIGGDESIKIQSMSTCTLKDTSRAIEQCLKLQNAGCEIIRFSVLDVEDTLAIKEIKKHINMPLVADVHFDYKLAISAIKNGADKIRINPGNIGGENKVKEVAKALKDYNVPLRVGSNTGSVEKKFLTKFGKNEISLGESALEKVAILEKNGVENIVISVKASEVPLMVKAYRYVANKTNYPLHLGVTEAGTEYNGIIKNSIGIGALLLDGIGNTIRVSLSADPVKEVISAKSILSALNLKEYGAKIIACPTCGRCEWDCMDFAKKVEEYTKNITKPLKIAVMGCVVNGPGEAQDADLGVAGSKEECCIFVKGKIIKKVKVENIEKEFFNEIDKCLK
ncbi:MAG: flavodoxin-dependent (E)-4-hydroxy-3-methylbut-2-enyl-diphosphate synthase [Clostridia bacterium]|nr:flavodoxin-dependent (E)-4-hydroxy-3-methylbut-2-enyl-diphosphate synthase [Clostridia bacterium]